MKKVKKTSPLYARLVKLLSSRFNRDIIALAIVALSVVCMFMMDAGNIIRQQHFAFLTENVVSDVFNLFGIQRFNVQMGPWLIFLCAVFAALAYIVADIFAPKYVDPRAEKNAEEFKSFRSAKRHYSFIYFFIVTLVVAALIFVFVMSGPFKNANMTDLPGVFLNLTYTVLLTLMFSVIIPLLCILAFITIRFILYLCGHIANAISGFSKDIAASRRVAEEQAKKELQAARLAGRPTDKLVKNISKSSELQIQLSDVFPALTSIDIANALESWETVSDDVQLSELAVRFQAFAAKQHRIYYELPLIRSFIAGMAASRLIILEGLSGTGKSTLPRMFSEFAGSVVNFTPVQSTWRDKTDIIGFFNEITKTFKMTDFLVHLYSASYSDKQNLMVLDELNLSRIEYYFADFLSVLEYPTSEWRVKVYSPDFSQVLPVKLERGYVTIPTNTWFIGTANTDDSTFTITDKVYDRAISLDFAERFAPVETDANPDPISMSSDQLQNLFKEAKKVEEYNLTKEDLDKFSLLCDYMRDALDVKFGNRIMVQIENFVPVYVALGGTKEEALDFMFARKVVRKLQGAYEDYVKDALVGFIALLDETYGKGVFKETDKFVTKILKRLV